MLLSLPVSFLGLSCFRSWIALLTSTSPLGGFAEPLHDCILTVSLLALASNVALAAYQFRRIRQRKLNPLKDELYADTKAYQRVVEENR